MGLSLRLRIWLTYGILICVVLCTLTFGLILTLSRSPLLFRNTVLQIRQGLSAIQSQISNRPGLNERQLENELYQFALARGLRIFLTDDKGNTEFDSSTPGDSKVTTIESFEIYDESTNTSDLLLPVVQDSKGNFWFYAASQIQPKRFLIIAAIRPKVVLRVFLKDELFFPLMVAGIVAFFLAFALSILLNKWITEPLKWLSKEAEKLADGQYISVTQSGPVEIQQLTSALNQMGQKVKTSNDSQREFLANVTHELKTPLTSIQGFAQSIMDGTVEKLENVKQSAKIIFDEAGRMNRLVLDLLTIARLESGTADLQKAEIDLGIIIEIVVKKFSVIARNNKILIDYSSLKIPHIIGDEDRLAQVFTNLIDNALKFTPANGKISITGSLISNRVEVRIKDTGIGIPSIEKERIFERFYQTDKSRKGGTGKGVGLGLPIAKQIILAHQGKIWVESELGKGSTFIVQLPISTYQDITITSRQIQ
jgi:two-component system OmpR family sensor kinase